LGSILTWDRAIWTTPKNGSVVMEIQVQRSANRGVAFFLFVGAFLLFGLGIVAGVIVYSRTSLAPAISVLGVVLLLSAVLVVLAVVLLMWRTFFPQTFRVREGKIQWLHGNDVVGQIPIGNLTGLKVLRESPQNTGGGLAAAFAQKRIEEGKGLAFRIDDSDDKDTFWPASSRSHRFEFQVDTPWEITYQALHDALLPLLPKIAPPPAPLDPVAPPNLKPQPATEKNPFDFQ
jgi:hypothetical protein